MKDTIAIVGSHPKTRLEFDFSRTDCDVWVFNEALSSPNETWCPHADAVFQMHVPVIWQNPNNRNDPKHYGWLQTNTTVPVYMQDVYPDVPMSVRYPLDDVCSGLNFNKRYFTSSVAYALALAAHLPYKRVEVYGVEMETDTEYRYQRDGVTFWLGIAIGRGKEVIAHCSMFDAPMYGYEGDMKLPYNTFTDAIREIEAKLPPLREQYDIARRQGAALIQNFAATGKDGEEIVKAAQTQLAVGIQFGMLDGARQECERYQKKADAMIEKSGDFVFSRQEFDAAKQALQQKQAELMTKTNVLAGQVETLYKDCEKTTNLGKRRKRVNEFVEKYDEYTKATLTAAMIAGALNQNMKLLAEMDKLIRAAGGSKSEAVLLEAYHASGQ